MKFTTPIIVTLSATFVALCGLIVLLMITNHDPTIFITSVLTMIPVVAGLLGLGARQQKTDSDVTTIKANTNGTLSNLTALVARAIAALPPAAAKQLVNEHIASGGTVPAVISDVVTGPPADAVAVIPPIVGGPSA